MCGICGVYSPAGDVSETFLRQMNPAQHHRGPDSEGYRTIAGVGLAVKRLKIIDLSPQSEDPPRGTSPPAGSSRSATNASLGAGRMGRNAFRVAREKYNWANEEAAFLRAYAGLAAS